MKQQVLGPILLSVIIGIVLLLYAIINNEGIIKWVFITILMCLFISSGLLLYVWFKKTK